MKAAGVSRVHLSASLQQPEPAGALGRVSSTSGGGGRVLPVSTWSRPRSLQELRDRERKLRSEQKTILDSPARGRPLSNRDTKALLRIEEAIKDIENEKVSVKDAERKAATAERRMTK